MPAPVPEKAESPKASLFVNATCDRVKLPEFDTPPPWSANPSAIVNPLMDTVTPLDTSNTRLAPLPLTVSAFAPRPMIVMFVVMSSSPLVKAIVWPAR